MHQELTSTGSETISGPGARVTRNDTTSWTIDAPNGYLTNADGSDFFLPASVSQQLTDVATQDTGYRTSLSESIIGYGALEEDNSAATITNGDTTGTITAQETGPGAPGGIYQRTVVTRGGVIVQDVTPG